VGVLPYSISELFFCHKGTKTRRKKIYIFFAP